eukprot:TRINITY_DN8015_c0_g1_i1.p1 TRINITY_DN8015_c0_g1~~TRINITY_DN8015_c0_g1_i1.p1  ORF type:complete len:272 (+),score=41.25 TRINITY_DN8015_c0_g1_i1:322-1137(+)
MNHTVITQFQEHIVDPKHPIAQQVSDIGNTICKENGIPIPRRYVIIDLDIANAFVIMGSPPTVYVFTGIIPVFANESGAAMVLAHEMGHILAHHSADLLLIFVPLVYVATLLFGNSKIGKQVVDYTQRLPRSRKNEYEADHIGLYLMASAGYDVNECEKVFERLEGANHPDTSIEFVRTHPLMEHRIEKLKQIASSPQIQDLQASSQNKRKSRSVTTNLFTSYDPKKPLPLLSNEQILEVLTEEQNRAFNFKEWRESERVRLEESLKQITK